MSDPFPNYEAAENILEDSDAARELVREIVEAALGDKPVFVVDISKHPHFGNPWVLDAFEDWKRWGVLTEVKGAGSE